MGKTPSRDIPEYWNNGENDWISIKDLSGYGRYVEATKETISNLGVQKSKIKTVPPNTLIMSFKLSIGKTAITTREVFTNEAIMAFLDKGLHDVDLGYMWHQLRTRNWSSGSNMAVMGKTLNKSSLGASIIRLPPIEEQREIARLLDNIVSRIEEAEQRRLLFSQLVKSRFIEMFGDPCSSNHRYHSIPGCKLFKIGNGKSRPTEFRFDHGVPAYGGNGISWHTDKSLTNGPTIIIGRVGRHCGNVRLVHEQCWVTDNAMYVQKFLYSDIDYEYLIRLMELVDFNQFADKGDLWKITQAPFLEFEYLVPPLPLQREFAGFAREVDKLEFAARQSIEKLQMLYDSLAQEYFSIEEE